MAQYVWKTQDYIEGQEEPLFSSKKKAVEWVIKVWMNNQPVTVEDEGDYVGICYKEDRDKSYRVMKELIN